MLTEKNTEISSRPKFFKVAYLAGGLTKFSSALSVSINTLLVALGASPFQIGLANSMKFFGKVFSQLYGLHFLNIFASRRKALMWALSVELILKLGLAVIAFTQPLSWFSIVIILIFLLGITSYTSYLAYYSWMSRIVPPNLKDEFFANRSTAGQVMLLGGLFISSFVLKLDEPVLFLLGSLYIASYISRNIEVISYIFHPDSTRKRIKKNYTFSRMIHSLKEKAFVGFIGWFNLVNTAAVLNVLYLEYFMIHVLKLEFFWIPLSLVLIAFGTIMSFEILKKIFPHMDRIRKLIIVSCCVVISSVLWLFVSSQLFLVAALFFAGFIQGSVKLVQRVETINYAKDKDEEALYGCFITIEAIVSSCALFAMSFVQKDGFQYSLIFCITILIGLLSFLFIRHSKHPRTSL